MRDLRDRGDVDHVERRIGRRFQEEGLGVRPHGGAPLVEVGAVDQRRRHAVARQVVLDDVAAGAEQRLGRDHVIAGLELAGERQRDRGHAGRCCARGLGALERRHARLEHRDRRIGKARVLKARVLVLEPALGLERVVVDVALGQEQRLGGLAELRAQYAGMDQTGLGAVAIAVAIMGGRGHVASSWPSSGQAKQKPGREG